MDSKPTGVCHLASAYCFTTKGRHRVLTSVTGNLCSLDSYILHNIPKSHYQPWVLFIKTLDTLSKLSVGTYNSSGKMRRHPGGRERCTNLKHNPHPRHGSCHLTPCSDSKNRDSIGASSPRRSLPPKMDLHKLSCGKLRTTALSPTVTSALHTDS